jgi:hypothetical protein
MLTDLLKAVLLPTEVANVRGAGTTTDSTSLPIAADTVTIAVADLVGSAVLVAVTATVCALLVGPGAV